MTLGDELRAMLDKAERYVASAEVLHAQGDYDSAISRLYYAMFYCAEALLTAEGLAYSSHKAVIAAFGQHFAKTGSKLRAISKSHGLRLPPKKHITGRPFPDRPACFPIIAAGLCFYLAVI